MIKTVKSDVQSRLRQKRLSQSNIQEVSFDNEGNPKDIKKFLFAKRKDEQNEKDLKKELEILDMLEQLDESHPKALGFFLEEAKKRGICKTSQNSPQNMKLRMGMVSYQQEREEQRTFRNSKKRGEQQFIVVDLDSKSNSNTANTMKRSSHYQKRYMGIVDDYQDDIQKQLYKQISEYKKSKRLQNTDTQSQDQLQKIHLKGKLSQSVVLKERSPQQKDKIKQDNEYRLNPLTLSNQQSIPDSKYDRSTTANKNKNNDNTRRGSFFSQIYENNPFAQNTSSIPNPKPLQKLASNASNVQSSSNKGSPPKLTLPTEKSVGFGGKVQNKFQFGVLLKDNDSRGRKESSNTKPVSQSSQSIFMGFEDNAELIRRQQLFQKIPKLVTLLEKSEKFIDLYKKIYSQSSTQPPLQVQSQTSAKKPDRQQFLDKSQQNPGQGINMYFFKNMKLPKSSIKYHLQKRYGKTLSDKIVAVFETYNKSIHSIDPSQYIELVQYLMFSPFTVQVNGQNYQVPNCFRLYFQILDFQNKGFICEHDLFQIIQCLKGELVGPGQGVLISVNQEENLGIQQLSINYKDRPPKVAKTIFVDSFLEDFMKIVREIEKMQSKRQNNLIYGSFNLKNSQKVYDQKKKGKNYTKAQDIEEAEDEDFDETFKGMYSKREARQQSLQSKVTKGSVLPGLKKKREDSVPHYQHIFEQIKAMTLTSLNLSKSDPESQQKTLAITSILQSHVNLFSHSNPISQMYKDQKLKEQSSSTNIQQELGHEQITCKQLNLEQFLKIDFQNDVPQLIDDLLMYLTTVSLKDQVAKITTQNVSIKSLVQKKSKQQQQLQQMNNTQDTSSIKDSELDSMIFNVQMGKCLKLYDKDYFKRLKKSFKMLSANYGQTKDKQQLFLTQQSIQQNFSKVFLVSNESLALRFYNILAEGVNMKRIYLPKYFATLYQLIKGNILEQNRFIFKLYDGDNDGELLSNDVTDLMFNVLMCPHSEKDQLKNCSCPLFQEIHLLYSDFVQKNILTYQVKKLKMDFSYFMKTVQVSVLIKDFQDKLLMKKERPTQLSHLSSDIQQNSSLHKNDLLQLLPELTIQKQKGLYFLVKEAIKNEEHIKLMILDMNNQTKEEENQPDQQQQQLSDNENEGELSTKNVQVKKVLTGNVQKEDGQQSIRNRLNKESSTNVDTNFQFKMK